MKNEKVYISVLVTEATRQRLRVLGAEAQDGIAKEAGRRLEKSVKDNGNKPLRG